MHVDMYLEDRKGVFVDIARAIDKDEVEKLLEGQVA